MIAATVALPVAARGVAGVVAGGRRTAYVEDGGFVVALTAPGVPLMPNGIALTTPLPPAGTRVVVRTAGAATWDSRLRVEDGAERGGRVLEALDAEPPRDELTRAVATRDPERARRAAERLVGLGPGLTPEGDDRLAGTIAVTAARGWTGWLPADLRRRTTALSATLLELAAQGHVIEPLHGLFGSRWEPALARLLAIGSSTGRAYATAAATAALLS